MRRCARRATGGRRRQRITSPCSQARTLPGVGAFETLPQLVLQRDGSVPASVVVSDLVV